MKWSEALKKYQHRLGKPCPITGKSFQSAFTDHSRGGYDEYGLFHFVSLNSCKNCHDDQRTISKRLRDTEEMRRLELKAEAQ